MALLKEENEKRIRQYNKDFKKKGENVENVNKDRQNMMMTKKELNFLRQEDAFYNR